jgi:hypothetical protein
MKSLFQSYLVHGVFIFLILICTSAFHLKAQSFISFTSRPLHAEVFEVGGKKGLQKADGKVLVPAEYDEIVVAESGNLWPIKVRLGQKYGLYNRDGQMIAETVYDEIGDFDPEKHPFYTPVKKDGLYGFLSLCSGLEVPVAYETKEALLEAYPMKKQIKQFKA